MNSLRTAVLCLVMANVTTTSSLLARDQAPFEPTWESLNRYLCPEWFRDAKLGIFICWNLHSLQGVDDWYARNMYIENTATYKYHVKTYGHPSQFGFKDFIPLWKAERFDADDLVRQFKDAGAKYIVPIATYHDNFDCWDSKHHKWNSVNMGPRKDIIGLWHRAAEKYGLRFGVTTHLARSWSWFQVSHGADRQGDMKGVPYDGADPNYRNFYHPPHGDTSLTYPADPPVQWKNQWTARIKDLCEQHHPDLLYFDGGLPFAADDGLTGREVVAWYYNQNMKWHGGKLDAVLNIKKWSSGHGPFQDRICVRDMERGLLEGIQPLPWQNDTTISKWFYQPNAPVRSTNSIVDMLVDIVSKNGNLLLNVPPKPDGALDEQYRRLLRELGEWMKINGEAIYATRPWIVYGEGPTVIEGGHMGDNKLGFKAEDIRFTCSKNGTTVYVILMDWPGERIAIRSLGRPLSGVKIRSIHMLGTNCELRWTHDDKEGMTILLPQERPCKHAYSLKIVTDQALYVDIP
jgi:alpha-L-fucosidase